MPTFSLLSTEKVAFIYEKSSFYFRKFVELGPYLSTFLKFEGLYDNFMKSGATIY
jgi:hypothetical protein